VGGLRHRGGKRIECLLILGEEIKSNKVYFRVVPKEEFRMKGCDLFKS
jgi:hypothetical protein